MQSLPDAYLVLSDLSWRTPQRVTRARLDEVTKGVLPFMLAEFLTMFLMVLFPHLVTVPAKWFGG